MSRQQTVEDGATEVLAAGPRIRPGALVVCLYLAATAPLMAAGGIGGGRWLALLVHLAALVAVAVCDARRGSGNAGPAARAFADLHMLVLIPGLYWELPLLMEGLPGPVVYHDAPIQRLEAGIFGGQPAWELAGALPITALSEVLHLAYILYYPIIYVPPLLLYAAVVRSRGDGMAARAGVESKDDGMLTRANAEAALAEAMLALTLSAIVCYVVFIVWPVQGPRYLGTPAGIPDGPIRSFTLSIVQTGSSRGAAFPSSHVAVSVAQTLMMLRYRRVLGVVLAVVTCLLAAGAVYAGMHYVIDALAGLVIGVSAVACAAWLAPDITAFSLGLRKSQTRLT